MLLVLVPVLIELVFVCAVGTMLYFSIAEYDSLQRSRDALVKLHKIEKVAIESFLTLVDFSGVEPGQKLSEIDAIQETIESSWGNLEDSTHPELISIFKDFESTREDILDSLDRTRRKLVRRLRKGIVPKTAMSKNTAASIFMSVLPLSKRVVDVETEMLNSEPGQIQHYTWNLSAILIAGALIGFASAILLVRSFTTGFLDRLNLVKKKAVMLSSGNVLPPPLEGDDEIAELDHAIVQADEELKQARQKEFAILDNARDVLCSLDSKLRLDTAGEAASKVWKYPPDQLMGRSILSIVSDETKETTRANFEKAAEIAGECEFENSIQCGDMKARDFLWKVSFAKDLKKYFCVVHDISELKVAQRMKRQFLSMSSTELRAPLTEAGALVSSMVLDEEQVLPPAAKVELEKANDNLARLSELVSELLDLDALQVQKRNIERRSVSALEVCRQASDTLEAMAETAGIQIVLPATDALVLGDQRRLIQVITNLLSNAIKFSPAGSAVSLTLDIEETVVTINVSDRGPGIPEQERLLIFDRFHQTTAKSNVKVKGSGLGLAIVKSLVEAHDGTVGVDAVVSGGSRFYVRLPRSLKSSED